MLTKGNLDKWYIAWLTQPMIVGTLNKRHFQSTLLNMTNTHALTKLGAVALGEPDKVWWNALKRTLSQ